MSGKGRPPKPTRQKVLQGTFRDDRANENEPNPLEYVTVPEPPWYLDYYAKKEWKRSAPILIETGLLTQADLSLFEDYCRIHAHTVRVDRRINKGEADPYEMVSESGWRKKRPIISILESLIDMKCKLANKLGLSPSDRTKIEVDTSSNETKTLEDILNSDVS